MQKLNEVELVRSVYIFRLHRATISMFIFYIQYTIYYSRKKSLFGIHVSECTHVSYTERAAILFDR